MWVRDRDGTREETSSQEETSSGSMAVGTGEEMAAVEQAIHGVGWRQGGQKGGNVCVHLDAVD